MSQLLLLLLLAYQKNVMNFNFVITRRETTQSFATDIPFLLNGEDEVVIEGAAFNFIEPEEWNSLSWRIKDTLELSSDVSRDTFLL